MRILYIFISYVWISILTGGYLVVTIVKPIAISGLGEFDPYLTPIVKGIIIVIMILIWLLVLIKMKNWVYNRTF